MKNVLTVCCLFFTASLLAQNYNDVAVIINQNSPTSIAIGEYFQTQRNIPDINVIRIEAPTTEVIDLAEIPRVFEQIKAHITTNDLEKNINYLVTTKGLPYIVDFGEDCTGPGICKVSLESKLTCLLSEQEEAALGMNHLINPYFGANTPFSKAEFGIFLVSRLDAYSSESVFDLIDRSTNNINLLMEEAPIILDLVNIEDLRTFDAMNHEFSALQEDILANNWTNITYDMVDEPVQTQEKIAWYHNLGFGPFDFFEPTMNWTEGGITTNHSSQSARTFETHNDGKLYLVDLIEAGASGGFGFVENVYMASLEPINFFQAYFIQNLNLMESNFNATRHLNNGFLPIGDPKTSVVVENLTGTKAPIISELNVFPNPSKGIFTIDLTPKMGKVKRIEVFNMVGALVYKNVDVSQEEWSLILDLDGLTHGMYQAILRTEDGVYRQALVVE